jgi:threonine aldolase
MLVDLRSDTITQPTAGMRAAMMAAPLGDDVLGDDPTVRRLEERAAELLGKEAAMYVPSGTMGNLIAIAIATRPGDEVLLHYDAHPFHYEGAGAAAFAGVQLHTLPGDRGAIEPGALLGAIRPDDPHAPRSALLCVEDTHNRGGGAIQPLENTDRLLQIARDHGLLAHLDGARLWNAVVGSGVPVQRRVQGFDTVTFCLSKGLGAPVGSVLCGPRDAIHEARRARKRLGGGMRQAGILAAAGLYALDHHVERLAEDHARAKEAADGLRARGFAVRAPDTNIVLVDVPGAPAFVRRLEERGVRCFDTGPERLRLVFHLDVPDGAVAATLDAFEAAAGHGTRRTAG